MSQGHRATTPSAAARRRTPVVLVVDDHDDTRDLYDQFFASTGLTVHTARDALTAIACADAHPVDAVVIDVGLPGPSGTYLATELRSRPHTKDAVLIAVSGFPPQIGSDVIFDRYLMKPCLPQALLDEIRRLLSASGPRPASEVA